MGMKTGRQKAIGIFVILAALACLAAVRAGTVRGQQFPYWERLLHNQGGSSDATPVPSMKMGAHMQMSLKANAQPGDEARAAQIVLSARKAIEHYADVNTALADGYRPFAPTGRMGEEVHYTNSRVGRLERQHVDYNRPGSILYKRTPEGMKAVGVMYTAPRDSTAAQLDAVAPLSVATWHRHVDFCGAPKGAPLSQRLGSHPQFGVRGSIHTEDGCRKAGGLWIPVVFGWMTHVYPDAKNADGVWSGMEMAMDAADPSS